MQKIGEHLDSGDDTSICAAPLTSPLQFLPGVGVRSAGHLPGCLAERGLQRWDRALPVSPSPPSRTRTLASVGPISVRLRFTPVPGTVPRTPDLQSLCPNLETGQCHRPNSALPLNLEHQIPINSLPTFVSFLSGGGGGSGGSSSLSALGSVKSARCLPLPVLL